MQGYMAVCHLCRPAKWILAGCAPLLCVTLLVAAEIKRVSPDDAMKAVTSKTKPEYNAIAKQLKLAGSVGVDVVIAEDGKVEAVTIVSGNPILAKLAADALRKWTFSPFKDDGKAVKVVSEINIKFNFSPD